VRTRTPSLRVLPWHLLTTEEKVRKNLSQGREILYNTKTKFLGIHITENMIWNNHIKYLSSKLNMSYYMISSLKNVTSPYFLRTTYFACFYVHLRFGLTLWGGDPETIIISRLQKEVLRIISKAG
jgi:hypothetical protein